jgi:hypothetical protein
MLAQTTTLADDPILLLAPLVLALIWLAKKLWPFILIGVVVLVLAATMTGGGGNAGPAPVDPPISRQKQDAHIKGTREYNRRIANGRPTSTWDDPTQADDLTREAWRRGTEVKGNPRMRELDFGRRVGTSPTGRAQTRVRVHEGKGRIHGHPSGPEPAP